MKEKTCPICSVKFTPLRSIQKVCGAACAIKHAINLREKKRAQAERIAKQEDRKVIKLRKEAIKSRSDWMKEAQTAFNAYIRCRDEKEPCISCGRYHDGQYHAGHYRTVGSNPAIRFSELNVHKQCAPCNNHKHGNIVEYRINLLQKIGQENLDWLEGNHEPAKYSIEDLKRIISTYKLKLKELKNGR